MQSRLDETQPILDRLFEIVLDRRDRRPSDSYVVQLLDGGWEAMAAKVREEAEEVVVAAREEGADALAREVADLVFHLFVLMAASDVAPSAVYAELERRFGVGGLEEKASRARAGGNVIDDS